MDKTNAIETNAPAIAPEGEVKVLPPTQEDLEAKVLALEEEKARLKENAVNYQAAYLKEKGKKTEFYEDESEEDRFRRIAREEMTNSRLSQIDREKDEAFKKALKENKELKLAHLNKFGTPPAAMGTHSEAPQVRDTFLSPEQIAHFKSIGKDDRWIENYKKNLRKNGR